MVLYKCVASFFYQEIFIPDREILIIMKLCVYVINNKAGLLSTRGRGYFLALGDAVSLADPFCFVSIFE